MGKLIENLTKLNYYTARSYYIYRLNKLDAANHGKPILVYQMGKVGSSSVTASLDKDKLKRRIYHIHFLEPGLIKQYEKKRRSFLGTRRELDLKHIWQYRYLYDQITNQKTADEKYKVITLVRDPVARNLATFFEHLEVLDSGSDKYWNLQSVEYDFKLNVPKDDLSELIELFFEKCRHDSPLIYFDREFKNIFGLDVYQYDFHKKNGYTIYENDSAEILLIRLEDLNRCATQAFKEFLDLDDFKVINKNIGSEKDYADIYTLFKDLVYLPESYLDMMYDSKFSKTFYSDDEISEMRNRWTKK